MSLQRRRFTAALATAALPIGFPALAQKRSFPGVTDTEIRIGSTAPLSGPGAPWSNANKTMVAYFAMVNAQGGINGRKVNFMLLDDGYSPPKTVEQTRKLVEREEVAFMTAQVGTVTAASVRKYLNEAKVPQLFVATGADLWIDELNQFPYSLGWMPLYSDEGRAIGRHLLAEKPDAKVSVLYQNDDAGRAYYKGLKEIAGKLVVRDASYEATDPTVDSQLIGLQQSGADVLCVFGTGKVASQAIRRGHDSRWRPQIYVAQATSSVPQVLQPAGLDKSKGVLCANFAKDLADPVWADDKGMRDVNAMLDQYGPKLMRDTLASLGVGLGLTITQLLRQCGDDLSRDNLLRQTMSLDLDIPTLLPGLRVKTTAKDRHPVRALRIQQFDGATWQLVAAR
ncbi:ABC transporter substrate-binding protein [Pseudorhodoferax sp.]|uniref:ABC transporter substrate-binding protein n=1 Tax=Pseudorhodoferax sp. TaxID=1993553 RepID=UPI002DD6658D|nr:ABC transporter substrate-binding protein [Pseudorhodoferax sp.]